jgi:hypothetical protein
MSRHSHEVFDNKRRLGPASRFVEWMSGAGTSEGARAQQHRQQRLRVRLQVHQTVRPTFRTKLRTTVHLRLCLRDHTKIAQQDCPR